MPGRELRHRMLRNGHEEDAAGSGGSAGRGGRGPGRKWAGASRKSQPGARQSLATNRTLRARLFCLLVLLVLLVSVSFIARLTSAQGKHQKPTAAASLPHLDDIVESAVAKD